MGDDDDRNHVTLKNFVHALNLLIGEKFAKLVRLRWQVARKRNYFLQSLLSLPTNDNLKRVVCNLAN